MAHAPKHFSINADLILLSNLPKQQLRPERHHGETFMFSDVFQNVVPVKSMRPCQDFGFCVYLSDKYVHSVI